MKKIIKRSSKLEEFIHSLIVQINLDDKSRLLFTFFLISNVLTINKTKNISTDSKEFQPFLTMIQKIDWKKFVSSLILFNKDIKKFLSNEFALHKVIEVKNNFLFKFNEILQNLKNINSSQTKLILVSCVGEFVDIACNPNYSHEIFLEDYYLILQELIEFCFNLNDDSLKESDSKLLNLIFTVFTSNNSTLHKLTKFFYEGRIRLLSQGEAHNSFIDNFLSIFDVLESFNTHLVKVLIYINTF